MKYVKGSYDQLICAMRVAGNELYSKDNVSILVVSISMNKHEGQGSVEKTSVHPCEQGESVFSSTQHLNRHEKNHTP